MFELLRIPSNSLLKKQIAPEKFFVDEELSIINSVESVLWYAALKPPVLALSPVVDEMHRYEEIQIFMVTISNPEMLYQVFRPFFKSVKYPSIVIIQYHTKYCVSACPFFPGKNNYSENILRTPAFSHWIYPELLSTAAASFVEKLNQAINEEKDLLGMYTSIYHAIQFFPISGLTKDHVSRLLKDMTGKATVSHLLDNCTPYKKHYATDNSLQAKYNKSARRKDYIYRFDTEDLWYSFMSNEQTRRVIMSRRYRDIEDLIYSIDIKLEESEL